MKLYLIQHGKALSEEHDPKRCLSQEGIKETKKIADFIKPKNIAVDYIWHSKKERAIQTAKIISQTVSYKEIIERNDINPNDPVDKLPEELKKLNKDVMIVGHLPFLQKLASLLLTGSETSAPISFINSGIICFDSKEPWQVEWFIIPYFL